MNARLCSNCDGSRCSLCLYDEAERHGGDQGPSALEIELLELREKLRRESADKMKAEIAAAEAQRAREVAVSERDDALTQLALLARGGLA